MTKLMTAEQAFNMSMNIYPILYSAKTIEDARFKFFDHIFNTIGNGNNTLEDFKANFTINSSNQHLIDSFPSKYITSQPLYTCYTKIKDTVGGFHIPDQHSALLGIYTKEEIQKMPEVKSYIQANDVKNDDILFIPYPNFQKEYSMIWRYDLTKIDESWFKAAKEYYLHAKEFFHSDLVNLYHNAAPIDEKEMQKSIQEYEFFFQKYKKENVTQEEYYQTISKNYNHFYDGDTKKFIQERWNKEKNRILNFIDETLEKIEPLLSPNIKVKKKI